MTEVRGETAVELRLMVLGGTVAATVDGETRPLGGPMQRRLLAALLADAGAIVSTDRLVESLWPPDDAPDGARRTVMSYVSRLRSVVGAERVIAREPGYVLVLDDVSYDAADFELRLAEARAAEGEAAVDVYDRALGLWSGRAFGDDADEWWLRPVAARLEELRLVTLEERAEVQLSLGRHADVVADLERGVAEQPLRERFVELLMRALYLSGRQAEALRTYRRFHDYLAEETGLAPSDELVELEHRVVIGDASLVPASSVAVPGYELGEVIGEGSFGSVYRAVQPSVGREVAVKVVRAELADDPRFVQRFEAEAQLVARLEHPHVVPLYDFWRRPGGAFLVFRLLRGGSLADRVAKGPMAVADVSRVVGEMASALAAAHSIGIVHRDVKPANVLFDEGGNTYLADFGIAVMADAEDDPELRAAGSAMYASPEQARDGVATEASDQYALAVVAWEALTGRAPFEGTSTVEVLRSKYATPLPALADGAPGAAALTAVLQRATAPNPQDRYPSMADFTAAFDTSVDAGVVDDDGVRTTGRLGDAPAAPRRASTTMGNLPAVAANPFKGLRAFQEADAVDFFGRAALVDRLVETVDLQPFTTVVGPSGSGKSSLVHAGAVPALRRAGALVASMVPGDDPLVELEAALRRVATAADEGTISARLDTPGGLAVVAAELAGPGGRLVLVLDQFEELWTLVASDAVRDRFVELIANAAVPDGPLRVIATLRADLYDRPLRHPVLGPIVSDSTLAVTPLSSAELAEAIEEPAARIGVRFEPGLAATMVSDVAERPGALPLLQFTLTELYELRTQSTITVEAYQHLGGISGALASRAEQLYLELDEHRRGDVRTLFTELVMPGDDADDLRRRARLEELAGIDPAVIERYRTNRLLVTDHHPITREPTVEVAHEALLREWPRLATWIDEDRDAIRVRRMIGLAATEWQDADRDESMLYRGPRLSAADDVARRLPLPVPEQEFLAASHELADREQVEREARVRDQARQNRRLRGLLAATAVVLVMALVFGAFAVSQRNEADDQRAQADRNAQLADANAATARQELLISQSQSVSQTDRQLGALLAMEADLQGSYAGSRDGLLNAVMAEPRIQQTFGGPTGLLETLVDDRVLTSRGSDQNTADWEVVDWSTGRVVEWPASSPFPDSPIAASSSGDGTVLAVLDAEGQVWTYAGDSLEPIGEPFAVPFTAGEPTGQGGVRLDGDGDVLVVSGPPRPDEPGRAELAVFTREDETWVPGPTLGGMRVTPHHFAVSSDGTVVASVADEPTDEGGARGDLRVHDLATGGVLWDFKVSKAYDLAFDWSRQRVVVSREIGGDPGDVSWYDLTRPEPVEQIIDLGLSPIGSADLTYDGDYTRLGVNGNAGFQAFDAATMAPPPGIAVVNTGTQQGPVRFVSQNQVLLASVGSGPVTRWDLTGAPSFSTPVVEEFDLGIAPGGPEGSMIGMHGDGDAVTFTPLDGTGRPSGQPVGVAGADAFAAATAEDPVVACLDPGSGRVAAFGPGGDVTILGGEPPHEVLSRMPGGLGQDLPLPPARCAWRPDGRQIAVSAGVTSGETVTVLLWDVADASLRFQHTVAAGAALEAVYRPDSEVLWQAVGSGEGVIEVTDLDGEPKTRTVFPNGNALTLDDTGRLVVATVNTIRRYDAETYEPLGPPIDVRGDFVFWLSPMAGGREVAVSTLTGWRLVDLDAERTLGPVLPAPNLTAALLSGTDPRALVGAGATPGSSGTLQRWDLSPARVRDAACALAGRNLTEEEWERYLPEAGPRRATCDQYPL